MVIEEQKDTLKLTESSLEKQEENIQDVTAVESGLEVYTENTNDISKLEEKSANQQVLMRWSRKKVPYIMLKMK